jgi:hypothetical protein
MSKWDRHSKIAVGIAVVAGLLFIGSIICLFIDFGSNFDKGIFLFSAFASLIFGWLFEMFGAMGLYGGANGFCDDNQENKSK